MAAAYMEGFEAMPDACAMIDAPPGHAATRMGWIGARPSPARPGPGTALRSRLWQMLDMSEQGGTLPAAMHEAPLGRAGLPGPIEARLHALCSGIVDLYTDRAQTIRLEIAVDGTCPAALEETVLHIARRVVGNTVRYGMRLRLIGRISVRLATRDGTTRLTVADDGWDCQDHPHIDNGLREAERLARRLGGQATLYRGHVTTVEVELPHRC